ncbi:glucose 1-dehydrogenase [Paludisphaera mucosa]|uniref:Glucose 1-dehydrogenase n=1 Tax=Paludisphaera mucosa TaxID=3030827 RepID=A0ABT6FLD7_9BACT|nr:glucose 1-dehydrogenase [Paludisphaera mucosa]MDG3008397.1 glucose 1-dehydrogenase [Paludisphaera mucosa]
MRLEGKTAFITGGNSGIGLAAARTFVAEGARVAITGRNRETLEAAKAELGDRLLAIRADSKDVASIDEAVTRAVRAFGKLDVVFANAGIAAVTPVGGTTLAEFEDVVRTDLTGVFFTVQSAAPHLNEKASIILTGSVHAVLGTAGWAAYAGSKGAVRSMTRVLASEFAPRGIRVNQLTPGATRSPIWNAFAPDAGAMEALERELIATIPLGRMGEAEEIAKAALFLASDDSSFITAAEIVVDGGATGAPRGRVEIPPAPTGGLRLRQG